MATTQPSTKRLAISKANAQMVGIVAGAAFVAVFCLFASKTVWSQNGYQAKIISQKQAALNQLKKNFVSFNELKRHYSSFNSTATNIIGGTNSGTGDNDGNNSKIILDALPSKYDFPALTSSLEKVLTDGGFKIGSISGTDDQLNQQSIVSSADPQAVPIPFTFSISGANYGSVQDLINKLEHSVRPIQVDTLQISGGQDNMTITVTAHTFYQAGKDVSITKKVVK